MVNLERHFFRVEFVFVLFFLAKIKRKKKGNQDKLTNGPSI